MGSIQYQCPLGQAHSLGLCLGMESVPRGNFLKPQSLFSPGLNFHGTQPEPLSLGLKASKNLSSPLSRLTPHLLVTAWGLLHSLGSFLPLDYCVFYAQCLKCPPTLFFLSWRTTQP